ncbi:MAG TPA: HAD domain-containing protein [Arthrobacter sp.]
MPALKPIILLDIDGVLNPVARPDSGEMSLPGLWLPEAKVSLVRRLAECGRIAWVSTWPADQTASLESQLDLDVAPLRVTLTVRAGDSDEPTPKLRSVRRWLTKMELVGEADWDAVVWIDDVLGPDAREWASRHTQPVLLERPGPAQGMSEVHVVAVEVFVEA